MAEKNENIKWFIDDFFRASAFSLCVYILAFFFIFRFVGMIELDNE